MIHFAKVHFCLQCMNIKAKEVYKIPNKPFGYYLYSSEVHHSTTVYRGIGVLLYLGKESYKL